jgi:hypothetical protein
LASFAPSGTVWLDRCTPKHPYVTAFDARVLINAAGSCVMRGARAFISAHTPAAGLGSFARFRTSTSRPHNPHNLTLGSFARFPRLDLGPHIRHSLTLASARTGECRWVHFAEAFSVLFPAVRGQFSQPYLDRVELPTSSCDLLVRSRAMVGPAELGLTAPRSSGAGDSCGSSPGSGIEMLGV